MTSLLTIQEAAARLALHPDTVRRLVKSGELPAVKIGRAVRVEVGALAAFVSAKRVGSTHELRPVEQITPPQLRALHAKADRADRIADQPRLTSKRQVLAEASRQFGRAITSANHLNEIEAGWVLERLDEIANEALERR